MNSFHFAAIILVFVFAIAPAGFAAEYGQDEHSDVVVKKGLKLSAELEGTELFNPKGNLPIKLKLENTGSSPTYIYKELGFGPAGLRISILDANNNWVPRSLIAERFPSPVLTKDDLQAIDGGKSIEESIDIALSHYEITPGDYTLRISYISPVALDAVPSGLKVLTSSDGALEAKAIRFKVMPLHLSRKASLTENHLPKIR